MNRYLYKGAVELFDKCVDQWWEAETYADSKRKALSNFKYRYKKEHGLVINTRINLPGKIEKV